MHGLGDRAFQSRGMEIGEISQKSMKIGNFPTQFTENCDNKNLKCQTQIDILAILRVGITS